MRRQENMPPTPHPKISTHALLCCNIHSTLHALFWFPPPGLPPPPSLQTTPDSKYQPRDTPHCITNTFDIPPHIPTFFPHTPWGPPPSASSNRLFFGGFFGDPPNHPPSHPHTPWGPPRVHGTEWRPTGSTAGSRQGAGVPQGIASEILLPFYLWFHFSKKLWRSCMCAHLHIVTSRVISIYDCIFHN